MDLGAADPTYILPACVTLGFLAVTEIGMDGIQMQARAAAAVFLGGSVRCCFFACFYTKKPERP